LTGTKEIFAFFLDSVARHLGVGRDGTNELVGPTKATLLEIAVQMAEDQKDYLARSRAEEIAEKRFKPFEAPTGLSWLEVLQRNGLLRFDPDPTVDPVDSLHQPSDVVRFSFQRFQDHLMAEALLARVCDVKAALAGEGSLSFVHDGKMIRWEWRGLVEALSIQLPERFEVELVDALPGDRDAAGKCQFIGSKLEPDGSSALIRSETFDRYLERHALNCIWLLVAERSAWPGGHNENAAWRRTEGVCWMENGKPTTVTWNEDRVNKK